MEKKRFDATKREVPKAETSSRGRGPRQPSRKQKKDKGSVVECGNAVWAVDWGGGSQRGFGWRTRGALWGGGESKRGPILKEGAQGGGP